MRSAITLLAGLTGLVAALFGNLQASADTPGTGIVTVDRLPWLDGARIQLTQGWFRSEFSDPQPASHYSQYGEDWTAKNAQGTPIPFNVRAVAEGNATCYDSSGNSGEWISLERSTTGPTSDWTDHYFHLDPNTCQSGTWPRHVEQGDFLAVATGSGSDLVHLHFEPRNPGGLARHSMNHCLSGLCNAFCDHSDPADSDPDNPPEHDGEPYYVGDTTYTCNQGFQFGWFVSDNVGPGIGAGLDPWSGGAMWNAYYNTGHNGYLCGAGGAWLCLGSSMNVAGEGRFAVWGCKGSPADCGWNQDFQNSAGTWHNISKPDACGVGYWVPHANWFAWANNQGLGQPRSTYFAGGGAWFQYFRNGVMVSSAYGGSPMIWWSSTPVPCT